MKSAAEVDLGRHIPPYTVFLFFALTGKPASFFLRKVLVGFHHTITRSSEDSFPSVKKKKKKRRKEKKKKKKKKRKKKKKTYGMVAKLVHHSTLTHLSVTKGMLIFLLRGYKIF